jgi:hypothetical protein
MSSFLHQHDHLEGNLRSLSYGPTCPPGRVDPLWSSWPSQPTRIMAAYIVIDPLPLHALDAASKVTLAFSFPPVKSGLQNRINSTA